MGECRGGDGLIKLFGKTIPVPEGKDLEQHSGSSSSTESDVQETAHQDTAAAADPSPRSEVVDGDDPATKSPPQQPAGSEAASQQQQQKETKLKKPDKILPCPRCSSMDTKFCYFNNYNVNQPRHFCKNCQRYWTAGGAMRNVPVGAGRRKNKNAAAASHFLQRVRACAAAMPMPPGPGDATTNATVLSFGAHDAPPPPATLDLVNERLVVLPAGAGHARNADAGSCSEVSSNRDDQNQSSSTVAKRANGVQQQHHPSMNNGGGAIWPYSCAPSPTYYTSGIAIPIYPAAAPAYWGCMIPPPGAWSLPWPVQSQAMSSPTTTSAPSVSSFTLGKHPREGDDDGRDDHHGNGKVWVPKTIRIDNADEVARSSIRSLFGFNGGDKAEDDTTGAHNLATVFEPKRDAKTAKHPVITSLPLLHTNPVALTRSATFQEGS